jgi:hypothetical protein
MDELDSNIKPLVDALNALEGIRTFGSCGRQRNPKPGQWQRGNWHVKFDVAQNAHGWRALEFLAWLINCDASDTYKVVLYPYASPPFMNEPGQMLCFVLEGKCDNPRKVGALLAKATRELYIPPGQEGGDTEAGQAER